jgi:hypothetical protein
MSYIPAGEPPETHTHRWEQLYKNWDYKKNPSPSYVVVCECNATGLMSVSSGEVINIKMPRCPYCGKS